MSNATATPRRPRLRDLAAVFGLIGVTAFGGQVPLLALLNRELADRRGWLSAADIAEAFTYSKLLPGPVVVQVTAYLGYRLAGARGTVVASTAFLAPSVAVMLLLGMTYTRIATHAGVRAALLGLTAAVVGIVLVSTMAQARKACGNIASIVVALAVCAVAVCWNPNPALLILGAGLLAVVREVVRPAPEGDAP